MKDKSQQTPKNKNRIKARKLGPESKYGARKGTNRREGTVTSSVTDVAGIVMPNIEETPMCRWVAVPAVVLFHNIMPLNLDETA
jgi:hypothetical protein